MHLFRLFGTVNGGGGLENYGCCELSWPTLASTVALAVGLFGYFCSSVSETVLLTEILFIRLRELFHEFGSPALFTVELKYTVPYLIVLIYTVHGVI